ncbi:hypothetical protein RND81_14G003800 [Saponaria officinalis]
MPEKLSAENLLNNIMESIAEGVQKPKSSSFIEEEVSEYTESVTTQFNRLFGRQKPVHKVLGGGKSADVLLWRNKKISASVLAVATFIWVMFEWLNYHFLSLICFGLALAMLAQFLWSNASGFLNRERSNVPRIHLPEEWFVNIGMSVGAEVNRVLRIMQDVACNGTLKQFLLVAGSLFVASVIGSWCNFLTVFYIGFVAAHTLPVLYEKYDDQVDGFVDNLLGSMQHHYKKIDARVLSRIPSRKQWGKKHQ